MARLNEAPALVDSFDSLRRRFLRQNRDIARVNSSQSLRIRALENECARLLSENLELRGQILHLEKEVESNNDQQRVAEHALQIKHKMEAQLVELGSLLASFGVEPPTKRLSPGAPRRKTRPARLSLSSETASPQPKKLPAALSPGEAETLAAREGRLPPIFENKTFPRQTLSREEILALQSADVDVADSPRPRAASATRLLCGDVKRIDEDDSKLSESSNADQIVLAPRNKVQVATKEPTKERILKEVETTKAPLPAGRVSSATAKPESERRTAALRMLPANTNTTESEVPVKAPPTTAGELASALASKSGAKRKFAVNDENAFVRGMKSGNGNGKPAQPAGKEQANNNTPIRELKNPKSIRSLASSRNNANNSNSEAKAAVGVRRPLAAKSTNDDISSPRKQAQSDYKGHGKAGNNVSSDKVAALGNRMRSRSKSALTVDILEVPAPAAADIHVDEEMTSKPTTPFASDEPEQSCHELNAVLSLDIEGDPPVPRTPTHTTNVDEFASQRLLSSRVEGRDTPPPSDISSQGEMPRPSRRARASVSYAEPNLRDKMRRPTKELFDAVAGEGKYVQRQQIQSLLQGQGHAHEGSSESTEGTVTEAAVIAQDEREAPQQHPAVEKRRSRASTAGLRGLDEQLGAIPAKLGVSDHAAGKDPYEFTTLSSPEVDSEESMAVSSSRGKATALAGRKSDASSAANPRVSLKPSRRSSAAAGREDSTAAADRHTRPSAARKRASMVALKRENFLDDDDDDPADSSYEPPAADMNDGTANEDRTMSTRDRISRRRSMML